MRFVRSITICFLTLIIVPRDGLFQNSDHDDHDVHQEETEESHFIDQDPFISVSKFLLETELRELENGKEVEKISYDKTKATINILLRRFDCFERLEDELKCEECVDNITEHIFLTLGASLESGLSEEDFNNASVILVYLISLENIEETCRNITKWQPSLRAYSDVILEIDGSPGVLAEEELETIFDEMSHNYHSESLSKCFNVETIFEAEVEDHQAGATEDELSHISPLIISYLLQGYCIGEATVTNPQAFIDTIFEQYGHGGDGTIHEEEFEEMLTSLSVGGVAEDQHNHAKRSLRSRDVKTDVIKREVADSHDHESTNGSKVIDVTNTCFTSEELLTIHDVDHEVGITEEQLVHMCPSLLQQILSDSCINELHEEEHKDVPLEVWLYSSIAVFIISLGAILGGLFLPCLPVNAFEKFIHSLIAMAIAVLAGDALIHLLPLAIGIHGHEAGGHVVHSPLDEELAFAWKSLACLLAIYAFYLLETVMGWWSGHDHSHSADIHMITNTNDLEHNKKSESQTQLTLHEDTTFADGYTGGCISKYGPLPMMIIIGDALHNFGDGLAIGAAFTAGIGPGVSTSIAVFCHEIPHELGDLAILLKAGLKLKWALFLNFLSALTCFAGLYLGIALATTEVARQWIFAVTAGMFLYVALADMMPQITNIKNVKDPIITFLLQNIFFLIGATFIFCIAIYEDAISLEF